MITNIGIRPVGNIAYCRSRVLLLQILSLRGETSLAQILLTPKLSDAQIEGSGELICTSNKEAVQGI